MLHNLVPYEVGDKCPFTSYSHSHYTYILYKLNILFTQFLSVYTDIHHSDRICICQDAWRQSGGVKCDYQWFYSLAMQPISICGTGFQFK